MPRVALRRVIYGTSPGAFFRGRSRGAQLASGAVATCSEAESMASQDVLRGRGDVALQAQGASRMQVPLAMLPCAPPTPAFMAGTERRVWCGHHQPHGGLSFHQNEN